MQPLDQLFEQFILECEFARKLRPETVRGYKAVFQLFLRIMPEVSELTFLTPEMLSEFFKRIEQRPRLVGKTVKSGVKKSTIKTLWSKLNVFFVWLVKSGYLKENPLKNIKPPRPNYDDYRRLEDSDINTLYSSVIRTAANPLINRRDTMMISLLLFCGLRKGEFISLQVKDVDLVRNEITVRGETSKSLKTRVLTMHPTLVLHVKEYLRERKSLKTTNLIVSAKSDSGLTRHGLKHWVKSLIVKSGVRFHLHQFRHTFACKLCEANVNVFKVQKMMGHTDIAMTMKYARSMKSEDMSNDIAKLSV